MWAMALWGFIVPAKVIRESNCVLYCPRMSGPNWARVPHPSTHDGVCLCVCMSCVLHCTCLLAWCIMCALLCTCVRTQGMFKDSGLYIFTCVVRSEIKICILVQTKVCSRLYVCTICMYVHVCLAHCVCVCPQAGLDRAWEQVRQHH